MKAPGVENGQDWSWIGPLSSEKGEGLSFHAIITIGPDEGIQLCLSDGTDSYVNNLSREQLLDCCENPSTAHVDRSERISRIRTALESNENETKFVTRDGKDLTLRISVPWGSEFGDLSIKLNIAGIPLFRSAGNGSFLNLAFERIKTSRNKSHKLQDQKDRLELEVEDLWQAKTRLDAIAKRQTERMQIFADTLNEYKRGQHEINRGSTK